MPPTPDEQPWFPHSSYTTTRLPTRPEYSPAHHTETRAATAETPHALGEQLAAQMNHMRARFEDMGYLSTEVVRARLEHSRDPSNAVNQDVSRARTQVLAALQKAGLPNSLRVAVLLEPCDDLSGTEFRFTVTAALPEGVNPQSVSSIFENRKALQNTEVRGPQVCDAI